MKIRFSTTKFLFSGLFFSLLFLLNIPSVHAATCNPPQVGNYALPESCAFEGEINGVYKGNLSIPPGKTLTINPNQKIVWSSDGSINLDGGSIIISETGQLTQANLPQTILASLGFDAYAAGTPVRIFSNNLFVCTSEPCSASAPAGTGNVIIEGLLKIVGGSPGSGKVLTSDASGTASWQNPAGGIPSGMIAAFASACPSGWTEYTAARGRYLVGVPSGGTVSTVVGTALTNGENRATGQHSHIVDPPNTATTTNGWHTHTISTTDIGGTVNNKNWGSGTYHGSVTTDGAGNHTHTVDIAAFWSNTAGSVGGTNAPYIQVRWCVKD